MSTGTSISESPGYAAVAALASLGSFPLLGCVFTGFILGGLLGFGPALAVMLMLSAAGSWLRLARPFATRPGGSRGLVVAGLVTLWGLANLVLYASVLRALCGNAWFALLLAVAALAWATRSLRHSLPAVAAGIALLAFHPVCLGLIASCAGASTWPQLFATTAQSAGVWPALSSLAWVALATLVGEWHDSGLGGGSRASGAWRAQLATCLLLKLPATLLGLLAGLSYYDVHGSRAGFAQTVSWAVQNSTFCARWFVAMALMAGLLALVRWVLEFLLSDNWGGLPQGSLFKRA
jgi:hypothetical protein